MKIMIKAECAVCKKESYEGTVLYRTVPPKLSISSLKNMRLSDEEDYEETMFICKDCLEQINGKSIIRLLANGFNIDLSSHTVLTEMKALIEEKGYTTTLDIKNSLRKNGYIATQEKVKSCIEEDLAPYEIKKVLFTDGKNGPSYYMYFYDLKFETEVTLFPDTEKELKIFVRSFSNPVSIFEEVLSLMLVAEEDFYDTIGYDPNEVNGVSFKSYLWEIFNTKELVLIQYDRTSEEV